MMTGGFATVAGSYIALLVEVGVIMACTSQHSNSNNYSHVLAAPQGEPDFSKDCPTGGGALFVHSRMVRRPVGRLLKPPPVPSHVP